MDEYRTTLKQSEHKGDVMSKFFVNHGYATSISNSYHRMLTTYYRLTLQKPTMDAIKKLYPNEKQ